MSTGIYQPEGEDMLEWTDKNGKVGMSFKLIGKLLLAWIFIFLIVSKALADTADNPCHVAGALLTYTHRGSVADSPCVIPAKTVMVEAGYFYSGFSSPPAFIQNFPQLTLTSGLPADTQLVLFAPSYNQQTRYPFSGFDITMLDMKHHFFIIQSGCSR